MLSNVLGVGERGVMSGGQGDAKILPATLPLTGAAGVYLAQDSEGLMILQVISWGVLALGGAVVATTVARIIAKRVFNA